MNETLTRLEAKYAGKVSDPGCFECVGQGWWPLLDRLMTDLLAQGWDGRVEQVKEKFGGLRFYSSADAPPMSDRVWAAEDESFATCEACGAADVKTRARHDHPQGWIKTYCSACHAAWDAGKLDPYRPCHAPTEET